MPTLSSASGQRAELRAAAHALKPVVLIGADGLTDAVLHEIAVHLAAHQLIKIRVCGDDRDARLAIYERICEALDAAPIQHIGKLLVIWKLREEETARAQRPEPKRAAGRREANAVPTAKTARRLHATRATSAHGAAPRIVTVIRQSDNPMRRPTSQKVRVLGNERVTAGGNVKRAKKRQVSVKRLRQAEK